MWVGFGATEYLACYGPDFADAEQEETGEVGDGVAFGPLEVDVGPDAGGVADVEQECRECVGDGGRLHGEYSVGTVQDLAADIEDEANNRTRFVVLGGIEPAPSGRDATSLVMSAPNRPGAVHALLEPLARHGVSMSRLESRPTRVGKWEYYFYVDLVGHRNDAPLAAALAELEKLAPFLKILGSYPAAQ